MNLNFLSTNLKEEEDQENLAYETIQEFSSNFTKKEFIIFIFFQKFKLIVIQKICRLL